MPWQKMVSVFWSSQCKSLVMLHPRSHSKNSDTSELFTKGNLPKCWRITCDGLPYYPDRIANTIVVSNLWKPYLALEKAVLGVAHYFLSANSTIVVLNFDKIKNVKNI